MSDKFKQKKWSVNSALNRKVKIKDGAFDTVTTKQKTKYMDFDTIYYISNPISEDEFAVKTGLWRTQRQLEENELMDENAYYKDVDEASTDDDIWIPRRESTVTTGTPKTLCMRETVLQREWQAKRRPRIPLPIIPESQDMPENWYAEPEDVYSLETTGSDRGATETYYTRNGVHNDRYMNFDENDTVNGDSLIGDVQTCRDTLYDDEQTLLLSVVDEETHPKFEENNEYLNHHTMPRYNKLPHGLLKTFLDSQKMNTSAIPKDNVQAVDECAESGEFSSCGSGDTNVGTKGSSIEDFDVREVWDIENQEEYILNDTTEPEYTPDLYSCESLTMTNMCVTPTPSVNVIKKLRMPTLEWSELQSEDKNENIYDETATDVYAPPIPPRIKMSATSNRHVKETNAEINETSCPEIPPRIPISRSRHSSENVSVHKEHRREEVVRQFSNPSGIEATVPEKKCDFCKRGRDVIDEHFTDQEELNRLQIKEEDLKRRNEVSKGKIASRREINAQLKKELENKKELHKLEQEEKAIETAIENVGKPAEFHQIDEYYGKFLPPPQNQEETYGSPMPAVNIFDFYSQRGKAEIQFGKNSQKAWRRRSIILRGGRKSFSTKIYAADSGIAEE